LNPQLRLKARYPAVRPTGQIVFRCGRTLSAKWAGRRSNPRYLIFSQALYRLSYQPKVFVRVGLFDRQGAKEKGQASF
jgi:hypothetical protein